MFAIAPLVSGETVANSYRYSKALLLAVIVLWASACARTRISSLVSPESTGHTYNRILVIFPLSDLELRKEAENRFTTNARYADTFVPSLTVFWDL